VVCLPSTDLPENVEDKEKRVKNSRTKALTWSGLIFGLAMMPGCLVVDDDDDDDPIGTLEVRWTIDGSTNPIDCLDFGADRLELRIYDGRDLIDEVEPFCEDFGVALDMFDGIYDGEATLVDSADFAVTVTEPLDNIDIIAGTTLTIDIDFPIDSFR
jgi:hypothetical protein